MDGTDRLAGEYTGADPGGKPGPTRSDDMAEYRPDPRRIRREGDRFHRG